MAKRTPVGDIEPQTRDRDQRERIESWRRQGRYRDLVLWMLGCEEAWQPEANGVWQTRAVRPRPVTASTGEAIEPTRADLVGALRETSIDPLPAPIREYIISRYLLQTKPLKTGSPRPRPAADDDRVIDFYARAYLVALDAYEADESPATRAVKTRAKDATANHFTISTRTIDDILNSRRLLKP
jgi:hypothetical protein